MALGDGIRRNIADVDPAERKALKDAFVELNNRFFPGTRSDTPAGGVSWWFKQDEIHSVTHVHNGPEFLPWHRQLVNELERLLREINPQLSLHYWDWTQDPRNILDANLGDGTRGPLNLFTPEFMGYGGSASAPIGEPWQSARYYVPGASPSRPNGLGGNPADPPQTVVRSVSGSPATVSQDQGVRDAADYVTMRRRLERIHDRMHGFVNMGRAHVAFRDPFVFLLHCNVDRIFAEWQTMPDHGERLNAATIYGSESDALTESVKIEPWAGESNTRPWSTPDNQPEIKSYRHHTIVTPPLFDTILPGTISSIVGTYENHLYDRGGKNNWHYVTISQIDDTRLRWSNRAGVSWTLTLTPDRTKLTVGRDCPYFRTGHLQATLIWDGGRVTGILGPWGELYNFEN